MHHTWLYSTRRQLDRPEEMLLSQQKQTDQPALFVSLNLKFSAWWGGSNNFHPYYRQLTWSSFCATLEDPRPSLCSKQNFLQSTEGNQERKANQEWSPYHFWRVRSWCKNHSSPGDGPSTALPLLQITETGLFYTHSLLNIIALRLRTAHCPFATGSY